MLSKRGFTSYTPLSTIHLPDLLEVPHSCETYRKSRTLSQNTLIPTKEVSGKLYYKIKLEIGFNNSPLTPDTSSKEGYSFHIEIEEISIQTDVQISE
jgi:hypothetical protein